VGNRAAEAGMDISTLAALLGHSKLVMVLRYVHPQEEHRAEAMRRSRSSMPPRKSPKPRRKHATTKSTAPENSATNSVEEKDNNYNQIN